MTVVAPSSPTEDVRAGETGVDAPTERIPLIRQIRGSRRRNAAPSTPRPPRPPRRVAVDAPREPLTARQRLLRLTAIMALVVLGSFFIDVVVLSHLQHLVSQQQLSNSFRAQLADGTAPVSEGDVDGRLLADGVPVALIEIPSIGVNEVVVEGTSSGDLTSGPGHRRDTSLPGQVGVSVIMGRAAAFGGPFGRIQELAPGETFTVLTGQTEADYEVIGVRYAGDASPPSLQSGEGRLVLVSARGPAYTPEGVVYVDAKLVSDPMPRGARQTTYGGLDAQDLPLATDTRTLWALIFALQLLVATEIAAVLALPRVGAQRVWVAATPVAIIGLVIASTQVVFLIPNLM